MLELLGTGLLAAGDEEIAAVAFGTGCAAAIVAIVAHQWRRQREAAYNARLKQMMIERGMSVDEIERVIRAGNRPRC